MVSSITKKTISLAISLLVVVISLTGVAIGATAPTVSALSRFTPELPAVPGKMARDDAGNFYVTDFWGQGIIKLDRAGSKIGFIPTNGRPTAVESLSDGRLVVGMVTPQPYVAFYSQVGSAPSITGNELAAFGAPDTPMYRPTGIVMAGNYIYVLDSGDSSGIRAPLCGSAFTDPGTAYVPKLRVYTTAGAFRYSIGNRTSTNCTITTLVPDLKMPSGLAYDKAGTGRIAVVDTQNGRILFFSPYDGSSMTLLESIGSTAGLTAPSTGSVVKLANPVSLAFEYDSTPTLKRFYLAEKGRNEITAVNAEAGATYKYDLKRINGTTVSGADLSLPNSLVFERTATGTTLGGVLYVNSGMTSSPANILPLSIDGGAVPSPTIALTMSAVPGTVTSAALTVSGTVSPSNPVSCAVNGGTSVAATGGTSWSANLTLVSGDNRIVCSSTNAASPPVTTYVEAVTYYGLDKTAPTVTVQVPATNTYTKNSAVTVSGTSNAANATVRIDNALNSFTVYTVTNSLGNWSAAVNLAEGSNAITASAWLPGSPEGSDAVTVTADYTNPTVVIGFLPSAATTNIAVQNIDGIVAETNLGSIEVNGIPVPTADKAALSGNNTYFSIPVTLVRGSNTVTVKATDKAGNIASVSRTVTLAPETPGFTIAMPADNAFRSATGSVSASGAADNGFNLVNAFNVSANAWSGSFTALAGFNEYPFVASGSNVTVKAKRTINTDPTFVDLAVTSPSADIATKDAQITLSGSVAAGTPAAPTITVDDPINVTISNSTYDQPTGAFSHTLTFAAQGSYIVRITSGSTTTIRNITYDTTAPEISVQADSRTMPSQLSGTIEPSAKISGITARINGVDTSLPLSVVTFDSYDPAAGVVVWHANLTGYAYSALKFSTTDPAGNVTDHPFVSGIPTGDVDGDGAVRLADALACLRHTAGTEVLPGSAMDNTSARFKGDVGSLLQGHAAQDGIVDIVDSQLILYKSYGLLNF